MKLLDVKRKNKMLFDAAKDVLMVVQIKLCETF
jgi:hypothetical protein